MLATWSPRPRPWPDDVAGRHTCRDGARQSTKDEGQQGSARMQGGTHIEKEHVSLRRHKVSRARPGCWPRGYPDPGRMTWQGGTWACQLEGDEGVGGRKGIAPREGPTHKWVLVLCTGRSQRTNGPSCSVEGGANTQTRALRAPAARGVEGRSACGRWRGMAGSGPGGCPAGTSCGGTRPAHRRTAHWRRPRPLLLRPWVRRAGCRRPGGSRPSAAQPYRRLRE